MRKLSQILLLTLIAFVFYACPKHWTEAIKNGEIEQKEFNTSIEFEIKNDLIIVPVQIENNTYHFLLDTGAPFSISKELQSKFNFKTVSEGTLRDSDNSQISVDYVSIPKIKLNEVIFLKQVAFVGDFNKNPIIECLGIDGIIGSNMMRFCNWKIDSKNKKIHISNEEFKLKNHDSIKMKFKPNRQYSIKISTHLGKSRITNLTLDYGSNGGLTVPQKIYDTLVNRTIIKESLLEYGVASSGLGGKLKNINRKFSRVDSLALGNVISNNVPIKTGKSGLLGTEVLSKHIVAINWSSQSLVFEKYPYEIEVAFKTFGLKIGVKNNSYFVSAIVKNSPAEKAGIEPNMEVLNFNHIDFSNASYCDYISYLDTKKVEKIQLVLKDELGVKEEFTLGKAIMLQ
ncbi:retropepsin-like aspartic protease [Urechidicola vernalis]|uniref:Aspartyl protease family protein n=1 Tax=Urechidicola vernalis TaxID=3075600 RepID=A0ABU2Y827_9FLAO|nr:aspartyl protease family protein [Urechidicola sp. P050]MDT0553950.1 aspartyl protease family protein [Urechidicola sp. P050]